MTVPLATVSTIPPSRVSLRPSAAPAAASELSEEGLRDAVERLVELHSVAMDMAQAPSELEIIRRAVIGGRHQLGVDRLAVFLRAADGIRGTFGTDEFGNVVDETDFWGAVPAHPMVQRALERQDYVTVEYGVDLRLGDRAVGIGWNAMIALWDGGEAIGWIACDNLLGGRPLEEFQQEVLKLFGASLAQALVRFRSAEALSRLNRELEERVAQRTRQLNETNLALEQANSDLRRLSHADGLTGIANRRLFDEALEKEWGRAQREAGCLSVALLDVDFFKQYNDSRGHQKGDEALRLIARCLDVSLKRVSDLAARYGGEEFALLLPNTCAEGAFEVATRVKLAVAELAIEHPRSEVASVVTASVGVATLNRVTSAGEAGKLVEAADRCLYRAKREGRDRVMLVEL